MKYKIYTFRIYYHCGVKWRRRQRKGRDELVWWVDHTIPGTECTSGSQVNSKKWKNSVMKNMRIDNKFTGSTDFLTISKCKKSELHTSSPELKTFKQVYK